MKFKVDENLPLEVSGLLREAGDEAVSVANKTSPAAPTLISVPYAGKRGECWSRWIWILPTSGRIRVDRRFRKPVEKAGVSAETQQDATATDGADGDAVEASQPSGDDSARHGDHAAERGGGGEMHQEGKLLRLIIGVIREVVLVISLIIWSVVGFLFWIPMLIQAIIHFSALVVYATITDSDSDLLAAHLERSVRFYLQGFRNMIHAVYRKSPHGTPTADIDVNWVVIVWHLLSTVLFWGALIFYVVHVSGLSFF